MDSNNTIPQPLIDWLVHLTEDELIRMTNRGTVQRVKRELEAMSIPSLTMDGEQCTVLLEDGTRTTVAPWLTAWSCSCPSRSVCKHVIIVLLMLKQQIEQVHQSGEERFSAVYDLSWVELKGLISPATFERLLFRLTFHTAITIQEAAYLTIIFDEEGIEVQIPAVAPFVQAICKPHDVDTQLYVAEAILRLQMSRGTLQLHEMIDETPVKVDHVALTTIEECLSDILLVGLSRLSAAQVDSFEHTSLIARVSGLPRIERLLTGMHTHGQAYLNRSVAFSLDRFKGEIVAALRIITSLKAQPHPTKAKLLTGESRSTYYPIPPITLHIVGVQAWLSQSGYTGYTYYMLCPSLKQWLTYTVSRSTSYGVDSNHKWKQEVPWGLRVNYKDFCQSSLKLYKGQMNRHGRLSSSESSYAIEENAYSIRELETPIYTDWAQLTQDYSQKWEKVVQMDKHPPYPVLIAPVRCISPGFDSFTQCLSIQLIDTEMREIYIRVSYTTHTQTLLKNLESRMLRGQLKGQMLIFGKLYTYEGHLMIDPITWFEPNGEAVQLSME
jgi:hypothetical protein